MSERQFYYTPNGTDVLGPVSLPCLLERVNEGEVVLEKVDVCEVGSEQWLRLTDLQASISSEGVPSRPTNQTPDIGEAERLYLQASFRLNECQAHYSVYGTRLEMTARDGLEFVAGALALYPDNPKYLNTKALLFASGVGETKLAIAILHQAAKIAPNDIQIRQNIRDLNAVLAHSQTMVWIAIVVVVLGVSFIIYCNYRGSVPWF